MERARATRSSIMVKAILTIVALGVAALLLANLDFTPEMSVMFDLDSGSAGQLTVYYRGSGEPWRESRSIVLPVKEAGQWRGLSVTVREPAGVERVKVEFSGFDTDVALGRISLGAAFMVDGGLRGERLHAALVDEGVKTSRLEGPSLIIEHTPAIAPPYLEVDVSGFMARASHRYKTLMLALWLLCAVAVVFCALIWHVEEPADVRHDFSARSLALSDRLFLGLLAGLLLLPMALMGGYENADLHENRVLATLPEFSPGSLFSLPSKMDDYLKDGFPLRDRLVRFYVYLDENFFRSSERMIIGRNNEEFPVYLHSREFYGNRALFTEDELEAMYSSIIYARDYLRRRGIGFYVFIAPDKYTVHADDLPQSFEFAGDTSNLDQVIEYFGSRTDFEIIDARQEVREARKSRRVYLRNDNHWNSHGGFVGYSKLINRIHADIGDVRVLGPGDVMVDRSDPSGELIPREGFSTIEDGEVYFNPDFKVTTFTKRTRNAGLPRLLIFRDSFTIAMAPFLAEGFSESRFEWSPFIDPKLIEEYQPDAVVLEVVEIQLFMLKNCASLLRDADALLVR